MKIDRRSMKIVVASVEMSPKKAKNHRRSTKINGGNADLSSENAPRDGRNWPNIEEERTACKDADGDGPRAPTEWKDDVRGWTVEVRCQGRKSSRSGTCGWCAENVTKSRQTVLKSRQEARGECGLRRARTP